MAVKACPIGVKPQFLLSSGSPAVGNQLFFYVSGSSTKQNTYTDSTGGSANANPIVLNALGEPTTQIWFTAGQTYRIIYAPSTDTDPPVSPIWTIDGLTGINDTTTTADQWVSGPAPTYVSATSFTLVGDQTSTFHVGRRVKTTNSGGTIYSTITASAFAAATTITVANDSGTLDAGLSAVSYGLTSYTNPSVSAKIGIGTASVSVNAQTSAAGIGNGADATDDTLFTYTLPANTLYADGQGVHVRAWGTNANTANTKTKKIWFAGTSNTLSTLADQNFEWTAEMVVVRINATHVSIGGFMLHSGGGSYNAIRNQNVVVADLTANASIIKITGASGASAASDIVGYGMKVWLDN